MHVPHQLNNSSIDIANQEENFNKFFYSAGEELANAASSQFDHDFRLYLKNRVIDTIYLEPPTTNETANALLTLNTNKAVGHDNIPAFFLKQSLACLHLIYPTCLTMLSTMVYFLIIVKLPT